MAARCWRPPNRRNRWSGTFSSMTSCLWRRNGHIKCTPFHCTIGSGRQAQRLHPCDSAKLAGIASHRVKWQAGKKLVRLIRFRQENAHGYQSGDLSGYHLHATTDTLDGRANIPNAGQTGGQGELRLVGIEAHDILFLLASFSSTGDTSLWEQLLLLCG